MKGKSKKLLSIMLAMVMLCGIIMPANVFAAVGPLARPDGTYDYFPTEFTTIHQTGYDVAYNADTWQVETGTTTYNGKTLYYLKNSYIYFAIDETGTRTYTAPSVMVNSDTNLYDGMDKSYQQMSFTLEKVSKQEREANLTPRVDRIELVENNPMNGQPAVYVEYSFANNSDTTLKGYFQIFNVDDGSTTGIRQSRIIRNDTADKGDNWMVYGDFEVAYTGTEAEDGSTRTDHYIPGSVKQGDGGYKFYVNNGTTLRWRMDMMGFPVMGHNDIAAQQPQVTMYSSRINGNRFNRTKLEKDIGRSSAHFTEIFTEQYAFANPFVLGSGMISSWNNYYTSNTEYSEVDGWITVGDPHFPQEYSVDYDSANASKNNLSVYSYVNGMQEWGNDYTDKVAQVWGFRDLRHKDNYNPDEVAAIKPPAETANRLAIFKTDNGLKVLPVKDDAELAELKKTYGNPVHTIRGEFTESGDDGERTYEFSEFVAALTPTVTAGWENGYLSITEDGTIIQSNISLSTPTFTFYKPKSGASDNLSLSINEEGKLEMTFERAEDNDAFIYVNIPYATVKMESAEADAVGNMTLKGKIAIKTLFDGAYFKMEKLGYGMKNKEFKVNGVKAEAGFNTASLIGMDVAEVQGAINTFPGEEEYDFSAKLNVFDLFKAEAEINVQALNDGTLIPNKVWAYINNEAQGIPLIYPVVVAELKGGGLGFDNLATTLKGDFFAIPPVTLKIKATGSILELASGSVTGEVGPGSYSITYSELELMDLPPNMDDYTDVIEEIGWNVGIEGQERNYRNKNYTGLYLHGGAHANFSVFDTIKAGGGFQLNAFAGLDNYALENIERSLYLMVGADGYIYGTVQIPGDVPIVGGMKIASTQLDLSLGAQTAITLQELDISNLDNMLKEAGISAYENLDIYGGVAWTGEILTGRYRVYYIIPDTVGVDRSWVWDDEEEWNWEDVKNSKQMRLMSAEGEQIGVMGIQSNIQPLMLAQSANTFGPSNLSATSGDLILMVIPDSNYSGTIEDFADALTVEGVDIKIAPDNEFDNEAELASYNAMLIQNGNGENAILINLGDIEEKGYTSASTWEITNRVYENFNVSFSVSGDLASLEANVTSNTLDAEVLNPVTGATYLLRTYLSTTEGGTDFLIDQREVDSQNNTVQYEIPTSGTAVPSGNYYVSTFLIEQKEGDFDKTKEGEETVWIPVDNKAFDTTITYTNTYQPEAPATVEVTPIGNEIMHGKWKEVADADGYEIAILQENTEGAYVETGKGYSFDVNDEDGSAAMEGVDYDAENDYYSMNMALTVGDDESVLEADKNYKISVKAYKYRSDVEQKVYGNATESLAANLPKYVPLDIKLGYYDEDENYNRIFVEYEPDAEGKIVIKDALIDVRFVDNAGNDDISYTATYIGSDGNEVELVTSYYDDNSGRVQVGDLSEPTMIYLTGTNNTTKDKTTKVFTVEKDKKAPVLTLTSTAFNADENGNYIVTGATEPGVTVNWVQNVENPLTVTAAEDGRFAIEGALADPTVGEVILVTATDAAGNESDQVQADIGVGYAPDIPEEELPEYTEPTRPPSGGGGGTTRYTVKFDTDEGSTIKSVTVNKNDKIAEPTEPTKDGYVFDGWYTDKDLTEKYDFESKVTKSFTLYAKWVELEPQPTEWQNPFTDVDKNDWYYENVQFAYENGLMNGVSETEFAPDLELTRGMFVTILYRLEGEPAVNRSIPFADVNATDYFANAVIWAEQNEIVSGVTETEFAPNSNITREQMATILYRYAKAKGYDVSVGEDTNILSYEDFDKISEYAIEALQYTCGAGLIKGRTDSTLNPQDNATRAETATILQRFIEGNVK